MDAPWNDVTPAACYAARLRDAERSLALLEQTPSVRPRTRAIAQARVTALRALVQEANA